MEDVGGSEALFTLGRVVTAVGHDGCDLIIEMILRLICPRVTMSIARSSWEGVVCTHGLKGVNGAGIGEVSLYLKIVSGA